MPYLIQPRLLRVNKQPPSPASWEHLRAFDALSQDPAKVSALDIKALRAPLGRVPRAERGVEWTERVVIAYCLKRKRSARVRSLCKSIINHWDTEGSPEKARDFETRFDAALASGDGSIERYFVRFEKRDGTDTARDLAEVIARLNGAGHKVFINSGTLLGAVREGAFLGHDDDIDLGLIMSSSKDSDVARELVATYRRLSAALDLPIKTSFNGPVLKIKLPSDVVVDLFPTWVRDSRVYVWPHTFGELDKEDLLPLATQSLHGVDMPAPADPEKMLALNYGEGWRTPDTGFIFPWAAARRKFRRLLRSYWIAVRVNAAVSLFSGKKGR